MYYLINIYKSVSARGPFASVGDAELELARMQELSDDGWIIVKRV